MLNSLLASLLFSSIYFGGYLIDKKGVQKKIQTDFERKIRRLNKYYQNINLLFVGLNDFSGISFMDDFFKNNILELLAEHFEKKDNEKIIINIFSPIINKPEYIDYILSHNLSLEDLMLIKKYAMIQKSEYICKDWLLPEKFGIYGNKYYHSITNHDNTTYLRDILKDNEEPLILYSCGYSSLMENVGSDIAKIQTDYKMRKKNNNYHYTCVNMTDPKVMKKVIDKIRNNLEHLLSINPNSEIMLLGSNILGEDKEELELYKELILKYNDQLNQLCKEYQASYIDISRIQCSMPYDNAFYDVIASLINALYYQKYENNKQHNKQYAIFKETNQGIEGMYESINHDYNKNLMTINEFFGKDRERQVDIASNQLAARRVLERVINEKKYSK